MPRRLAPLFLAALVSVSAGAMTVASSPVAHAQQMQRIAAVVNDEIISVRDLRDRIEMVIITSQLPRNSETAQRLAPQVLRNLIDEQLQMQEADRLSVSISESEMDRARSDLEARNGLRPGQFNDFITQLGVDPGTVERQLRANLLWSKLVQRRFASQVEISAEEVDETRARLAADVGKEQKRVSEILLTIEDPTKENEVVQLANRLVEQIRGGASFGSVARQFSQAANANVGGDIGWVLSDQLAPELAEVVETLSVGDVSDPISTIVGYHILQVSDTRVLAKPDPGQAEIRLSQVFLPVRPSDDAEQRRTQTEAVRAVTAQATSCDQLATLAKEAGSPVAPDLGTSRVAELPANLRTQVADLQVGETSAPIDLPNGVMAVMVCERTAPESNLPDPAQIRRQLENQRFEVLAQRYLRDLRQAAFIETRV
ncbi:peptidylprolyl isomerase [Thalassobaculum litoreum]|uniref:Parvulin-like PPIase n=1 Tax=Thalassobaculum litoreum DSM 18839 TaxID=1123362 RepID=A0A8G2BDQ7_9PROT|nr:peptidylprolyl isomerase [Thalassobaculum litoreum]SDF05906.1 periplasmic chaperone for outer membrane proteins SurA [Thalassobaculum litoreum DSM 18839]